MNLTFTITLAVRGRRSGRLVDLLKVEPSGGTRHESPSAHHRDDMIRFGLMT